MYVLYWQGTDSPEIYFYFIFLKLRRKTFRYFAVWSGERGGQGESGCSLYSFCLFMPVKKKAGDGNLLKCFPFM
jgi:hypothetical protein